jgi:CRISPR-associated protein Cas5d
MREVVVDVWGDFACFTQTESKVERVTYDVPTPSACRGVLSAIYCKPAEFYYEITKIEVMNPIRYLSMKRNEVMRKADKKHQPLYSEEIRTQRGTVYLRDVYYRIHARMIKRPDYNKPNAEEKFRTQFTKRVERGKCFYQPFLGTKECMCFFGPPDMERCPTKEDRDLGIMLYDIFDIRDNTPLDTENGTGNIRPSYYHPHMIKGVIQVPGYESGEIMIPGRRTD